MISREALAYAAGLYEGEGTIFYRRGGTQINLSVTMMDKEPVEQFGGVLGLGCLYGPYHATNRKPVWRWYVGGHEKVQAACAMLWGWLGPRRRAQITDVLARSAEPYEPFRHTPESRAKITGRPRREVPELLGAP